MALSAKWLCFAFAIIFGICWAGASEEPCYGNVGDTEVYAPFGSWALFNCTHNCTKADWESRLIKRNKIDGPGWVSVEVGVGVTDKEWKASEIACTVLSRGEAVDNFVTVIPYEIPRLVTLDMEDMLEEGKSYIITCTVHGVAPIQNLRVTMLRGKELIYNKTFKDDLTRKADNITEAVTYQITAERSDNMEDFSCQATLALGTVIGNVTVPSSNVTVRTFALPDKPKLEVNQWIKNGTRQMATCKVSNAFPPEHLNLTMIFNTITLSMNKIKMADGSVLGSAEIPPDTLLGTYRLLCKAELVSLSSEASTDIHIYELPDISFTVSNDSVLLGDSITASCLLNNNNSDPYGVTIRLNGEEICKDPAMDCNVPVNRRSPQSLVSCEAFIKDNTDITVRREKSLTVHYSPQFQDDQCPGHFALREGNNGPFKCQADGNPPPTVTCSSDSWILPTDRTFDINKTHSGSYECQATNMHGVQSKSVMVEVQYPPATPNITAVPTATIPKGGALNVTCWADGLPQPEYRWVIPNGASVVYMNNNSVIFIPEASTSHSGNYTCHAVNQHGESPVALVITVTGKHC
ncbi:hypothetical protein XENTR_v10009981 [Xenopus tropicalis]|nr:hypothetical protein XENTR_v10009981 [Xenopus tropicalis]